MNADRLDLVEMLVGSCTESLHFLRTGAWTPGYTLPSIVSAIFLVGVFIFATLELLLVKITFSAPDPKSLCLRLIRTFNFSHVLLPQYKTMRVDWDRDTCELSSTAMMNAFGFSGATTKPKDLPATLQAIREENERYTLCVYNENQLLWEESCEGDQMNLPEGWTVKSYTVPVCPGLKRIFVANDRVVCVDYGRFGDIRLSKVRAEVRCLKTGSHTFPLTPPRSTLKKTTSSAYTPFPPPRWLGLPFPSNFTPVAHPYTPADALVDLRLLNSIARARSPLLHPARDQSEGIPSHRRHSLVVPSSARLLSDVYSSALPLSVTPPSLTPANRTAPSTAAPSIAVPGVGPLGVGLQNVAALSGMPPTTMHPQVPDSQREWVPPVGTPLTRTAVSTRASTRGSDIRFPSPYLDTLLQRLRSGDDGRTPDIVSVQLEPVNPRSFVLSGAFEARLLAPGQPDHEISFQVWTPKAEAPNTENELVKFAASKVFMTLDPVHECRSNSIPAKARGFYLTREASSSTVGFTFH